MNAAFKNVRGAIGDADPALPTIGVRPKTGGVAYRDQEINFTPIFNTLAEPRRGG
jgi:hypothetical protein